MKPIVKKGKAKIPAQRVSSDDCAINIGQVIEEGVILEEGTPYYVHAGEWVEVMPVMSVREVMNLSGLQQGSENPSGLGNNLIDLCKELSKRILSWNWTDLMGEPLPQPYNHPEVLEGLASEELLWLVSASSGQESPDERKKESDESENTS